MNLQNTIPLSELALVEKEFLTGYFILNQTVVISNNLVAQNQRCDMQRQLSKL
jgi:hypothetical protein